jgi:transcriptional regulator with XRE-family HTH domain
VSARETFARILRGYREQAGLTQQEAAQKLRVSLSLYKKLESCDRRPQREHASLADELYKTPGVFAALQEDVIREPYPDWFGPRVLLEDQAVLITEWEMRGVPGLLQTEGYARTVTRAGKPYAPPDVIERSVASRLERQEILSRDNPPKLWEVIAEGVVRQIVGGPDVMAAQLDHLIASADAPGIVLQVLPFTATDAPGAEGPGALFEFDGQPPVAYLEGWGTGRVVEDPKEVAGTAAALNMIKGCALSPSDSKVLLTKIRAEVGRQ